MCAPGYPAVWTWRYSRQALCNAYPMRCRLPAREVCR
jgi:hypothetical protein